jgi:hypothetical protein
VVMGVDRTRMAVLSNVLLVSRLEAGGLHLDRSDFELGPAVEDACPRC